MSLPEIGLGQGEKRVRMADTRSQFGLEHVDHLIHDWCSLGMAPLSGLEAHKLAPRWHKVGTFVFRHGEHFYNFEGLRAYKEKFKPVWRPKYLAGPGGIAFAQTLLDVTSLISGGLKGIVSK